MKENFFIKIESLHVQDNGTQENPFNLSKEQLSKREVITIDIANDPIPQSVTSFTRHSAL